MFGLFVVLQVTVPITVTVCALVAEMHCAPAGASNVQSFKTKPEPLTKTGLFAGDYERWPIS